MKHVLRVSDSREDCVAAKWIVLGLAWDLNASDPEGRRNAEHIEFIVVVDLVPSQSHLVSSKSRLAPLRRTATGPSRGRM